MKTRPIVTGPVIVVLVLLGNVLGCSSQTDTVPEAVQDVSNYPPQDKLMIAASEGNLEQVTALVSDNPMLVHYNEGLRQTPLHMAAYSDHLEVVEYLLAHGANPMATDQEGYMPSEVARRNNASEEVLAVLRDAEAAMSGASAMRR